MNPEIPLPASINSTAGIMNKLCAGAVCLELLPVSAEIKADVV
jgi:hypothetical protein